MSNRYLKTEVSQFYLKAGQNMEKMKTELEELRRCLDRNVARETEYLQRRIDLLESCNATLSSRLASAQREIAALQQQALDTRPAEGMRPETNAAKLYVVNRHAQRAGVAGLDGLIEHVTAA